MERRKQIIEKYRGKGFKLTPQRIAILEFLEGNVDHPTAEDIFSELKKTHPTVSFATVYNTLQALSSRGELSEVTIDPKRKHYDPDGRPHHHIICSICGRIGDVFKDYSEALKVPDEQLDNFTVTGNHVNFYGRCKGCEKDKIH